MKLRCLDLFSGIGGFSIATRECGVKTVAFCDIDSDCRSVLKARISSGELEKAQIYNDVKDIKGEDVKRLKANMITAGFPCVDISVAKPGGMGIRGSGSGLFKEVLRIIDESDMFTGEKFINTVFLENSSNIINPGKGYEYVRREMMRRGFVVRYCIVNAHMVGAYHKRLRWYCLCVRGESANCYKGYKEIPVQKLMLFDWKGELAKAAPRKLIRTGDLIERKKYRVRCAMLGNSIVPQCAMLAWNVLVGCGATSVKRDGRIEVPMEMCNMVDGSLNLTLSDGVVTLKKRYWATPVRSVWHFYTRLSKRAGTILCNQIYYEVGGEVAVDDKRRLYNEFVCNPEFVEVLMGYRPGWTVV